MKNDSPAAALAAYRRMCRACVRNRLAWDGIRRRLNLVRIELLAVENPTDDEELASEELFICAVFAAGKADAASVPAPRARLPHNHN